MSKLLVVILLLTAFAGAQMPVPEPPRTYIDTSWNSPLGGSVWKAHTSADFTNALNSSLPGDIIILDAGSVYTGNFTLPAKANPNKKWIYIESSGLSRLPAAGTRIDPKYVSQMPKIVTPNAGAAISPAPGADHWRLVGLEITSASNQGCNPTNNPPINCFTYFLFGWQSNNLSLPDSITVDRCYLHGSPTQDVREGVQANGTNFAVIDSYISDIHQSTFDSQAIIAYYTSGPIKIVNNFLSATAEDVMFGGAGGGNNPYAAADIEIRRNHFYKPPSWDSCGTGGTVGPGQLLANGVACPSGPGAPNNQWSVKNNLEFKNARRVVATGNIIENNWVSAQTGSSVLFTVRTNGDGPLAVVDDILFQSNIVTNVDSGINTLEEDDLCGPPNCTNPGETKRIWVDNNLFLISPSLDTYQHAGLRVSGGCNPWSGGCQLGSEPGMTDFVFQHNTVLMSDNSTLWSSIFFSLPNNDTCTPISSPTHNVWILDNAMTRQPSGDCGYQGTAALNYYMGDPSPVAPRFLGNVMFVPSNQQLATWPLHNYATTIAFTYVAPGMEDYQLLTPYWTDTSDGHLSGIDWSALQAATGYANSGGPPSIKKMPAIGGSHP